jgi:lysozyme
MNFIRLYAELVEDEGRRSKPYTDTAGKLTIGVGRNLTDRGLSSAEIDLLLQNDVADALSDCAGLRYFPALDDVRQRVVVNMVFNLGLTKFIEFSRLQKALGLHDYQAAAREMADSKWAREDVQPSRSGRLIAMMRTGQEP